jgi:hypothetical protein
VRTGAVGCLELLDHYIARVERLDDRTSAVVVRDFDRACDRALASFVPPSDWRLTLGAIWPVRTTSLVVPTVEGGSDQRRKAYSAAIKLITTHADWMPMFACTVTYGFSRELNFRPYRMSCQASFSATGSRRK